MQKPTDVWGVARGRWDKQRPLFSTNLKSSVLLIFNCIKQPIIENKEEGLNCN